MKDKKVLIILCVAVGIALGVAIFIFVRMFSGSTSGSRETGGSGAALIDESGIGFGEPTSSESLSSESESLWSEPDWSDPWTEPGDSSVWEEPESWDDPVGEDVSVDENGWTSNMSAPPMDRPKGATPTATPTPTPTPSPTPTPTPTPTEAPAPTMGPKSPPEAVLAQKAGTVIPENAVDGAKLYQYFTSSAIMQGDAVYNRINGKSYRDNSDIQLSQLRYLKVLHRNYNGRIQVGELICNAAVAQDLLSVFRELFQNKYQIYSMRLVDDFWTGDALTTDEASVRANNTSAFNYRRASDSGSLSNHALGKAVDVNPRHNPYVVQRNGSWYTDPEIDYDVGEEGYADPATRPGRLHAMTSGDICVQIFKKYGFAWGGDWTGQSRDFQHFEKV